MNESFTEAAVKHTLDAMDKILGAPDQRPTPPQSDVDDLLAYGAGLTTIIENVDTPHNDVVRTNDKRDGVIAALRIITGQSGSGRRFGPPVYPNNDGPEMKWVDEMRWLATQNAR